MNLVKQLMFHVDAPGETAAGIRPHYEEVTVSLKYGEPEENLPDLIEGLSVVLAEHYDTADSRVFFHQDGEKCAFCKSNRERDECMQQLEEPKP